MARDSTRWLAGKLVATDAGQCEHPEPQPWAASGASPSSTWNEWPQPHAEETFGLSILNPDSFRPSRKSMLAPWRYGALNGSTTTRTPYASSS